VPEGLVAPAALLLDVTWLLVLLLPLLLLLRLPNALATCSVNEALPTAKSSSPHAMSAICAPGIAASDIIAAVILTLSSIALNSSAGIVPFSFSTA
jgi:hypothetical protein